MNNWFTIEKIDETTFAISEYGHWEKMHSYILFGTENALLIDTGLGIGNIKNIVDKLTKLPVIVVTTHAHWDHIGGHDLFDNICVHEEDANWLRNGLPIPLNIIKNNIMKEAFTINPPEEFNINDYTVYKGEPTKLLKDNDIIDIGSREIKVLHTPGHSPGHICLFEEEKGYLYSGDLIYQGTLYANYPSTNPLHFKQSIDKLSNLKNITKILPAHNDIDISLNILQKLRHAFSSIDKDNLLVHGSGIFEFGNFKISL